MFSNLFFGAIFYFIVFDYCYIEIMHGLPLISMMNITQDKKQENDLKNIRVVPPKMGAGAKIIGNYILGKNIGQGTFGKVYMAMHWPTNEKVAVKVIDKTKIKGNDVNRVKNQIKILSTTRHRNIIHLYQIIQTEKSLLLVMQFMPNGQLFRHILKQKKLEQAEACSIFQQIMAGVEYLHNSKIAHRDLKPQNILIDYDNQVKIIDFGLGAIYQKNNLKSFCGSPCYAAPEIIQAKKSYNPLMADLWSCGVILYVMLAGHLPFCDQNNQAVYKKVLSGSYKIPPHISSSAKDLIQNLLVLNPTKRLSIEQIKNHDWYNMIAPKNAFGIPRQYFIEPNSEIINKMSLDVNQKRRLHQSVLKDERNKLTASYNILIKKIVKKNQKIQQYIGSDFFNPAYLKKFDAKQYDDTKSNEVVIQTKPILIEAPSAEDAQVPQMPLDCQSTPWTEHYVQQEIRPLNNQNSLDIFKGIIDVFSGKMSKKMKVMQQIMHPNEHTEEKIQIKDKQACFYENNIGLKNKFLNLEQVKQKHRSSQLKDKQKKKARSQLNSLQHIYRTLITSNVKRISRPISICKPIFSDLIKYKKEHAMNEQQLRLPKVIIKQPKQQKKLSRLQLKKLQLKNIYLVH